MRSVAVRITCLGLLSLGLLGCKSGEAERERERGGDSDEAAPASDGTILTPYLVLGQTLAGDRLTDVDRQAEAIIAAAGRRTGEPGVADVRAAAERLADAGGDIEATRAVYRELSFAVLAYLDHQPKLRADLQLVYCPMTFANDGGYWVQRGDEVLNPYEGARMLDCGATLDWAEGVAHRRRWAEAHASE